MKRCPVTGHTWCPLCYENVKGKANHKRHLKYRRIVISRRVDVSQFFKKKPVTSAGSNRGVDLTDCLFASRYPALGEYLTLTTCDDGSVRQTSTVLLFQEDGLIKLCINDRDLSRSAFVSGHDLESAFQKLEEGLVTGDLDWRLKKGGAGRR